MAWRVCASSTVSVAMRVSSMGYGLHGHDVTVTVCACYKSKEGHADLEALARELEAALRDVDHRPLWEAVGGEGLLEDLVEFVLRRMKGLHDNICYVAAETRGRSVELEADDEEPSTEPR